MFFMASTSRFVKLLLKYGVLPAFDVFFVVLQLFLVYQMSILLSKELKGEYIRASAEI